MGCTSALKFCVKNYLKRSHIHIRENDLKENMADVRRLLDSYFDNVDVRAALTDKSSSSMYHAFGDTLLFFERAAITKQPTHIQNLEQSLKNLKCILRTHRPKQSAMKILMNVDYNKLTAVQVHAHLLYGGYHALKGLTTLLANVTTVSLVKAVVKLKKAADTILKCKEILSSYPWDDKVLKENFESTFKLGFGLYSITMGSLPNQMKTVIGVAGYSGKTDIGLENLRQASQLATAGGAASEYVVLSYETFFQHYISHKTFDPAQTQHDLDRFAIAHPESILTIGYRGLVDVMKGDIDGAEKWFLKGLSHAEKVNSSYTSLYLAELIQINALKGNTEIALKYLDTFSEINLWSPPAVHYFKAVIRLTNETNQDKVHQLMREVETMTGKVAFTMEDFVIRKSQRYFEQNNFLCLPLLEFLFYINKFNCIRLNEKLSQKLVTTIDKQLNQLPETGVYAIDNKCLALLLKAACLASVHTEEAEELLKQVLSMEKKIKEDIQLIPFTYVELANIEMKRSNGEAALKYLKIAKKKYSDYFFYYKLLPIMHSMKEDIKSGMK